MYSDTKQSITHVVESHARESDPRLSRLYVSLSIQKDRLFAWGLQWADATSGGGRSIDVSLDKAGISGLVESIMGTISKYLTEAERLQLPDTTPNPESLPLSPSEGLDHKAIDITTRSAATLEQIIAIITTSIDTLCDLSREQQTPPPQNSQPVPFPHTSSESLHSNFTSGPAVQPLLPSQPFSHDDTAARKRFAGSSASYEIDIRQVKVPGQTKPADAPPSYESVAAGTGIFVVGQIDSQEVLIEYSAESRLLWTKRQAPSHRRCEELLAALRPEVTRAQELYTGTLRLKGWFSEYSTLRHGFIYELPPPPSPKPALGLRTMASTSTLHTLLSFLQFGADLDSSNMPALEDRFKLALNIASSVAHLHSRGILHRNLNSGGILFFTKDEMSPETRKIFKEGVIRKPFVAAFDNYNEDTPSSGSGFVSTDIYRHPSIESNRRSFFKAGHDAYSLGLILLEIGLWMPLHKLWKARYTRLDFKRRIQTIYVKRLMAKCGSAYMRVVERCLGAADQDNSGHLLTQPERQEPWRESSKAGPNPHGFWERIVVPLGRCCLMDDNDEPAFASLEAPRLGSPIAHVASDVDSPHGGSDRHQEALSRFADDFKAIGDSDTPRNFDDSRKSTGPEIGQDGDLSLPSSAGSGQESASEARPKNPGISWQTEAEGQAIAHIPANNGAAKPSMCGNLVVADDATIIKEAPMTSGPQTRARRKCFVQCCEIPADCRSYWETMMVPKLQGILRRVIDRWESYSIDVLMIGDSMETAKPTIYMMCDSIDKAKKALRYVNRDRKLFDIKVVKGQIERSKARKRRKPPKAKDKLRINAEDDAAPLHQRYDPRPGCGASIGAYIDGQHLPPVSFGGTLLVDDHPYAMSVHHMLEDDGAEAGLDDALNLERSMMFREDFVPEWSLGSKIDGNLYALSEDDDDDDDDDDGDQSSFSDFSEAGDWFGETEESWSEDGSIGDTPGFSVGTAENIYITQPAIDDVAEGFFPNSQDMKEEHLLSHKLGHLHASSGIKRVNYEGTVHEVDWALIKVDDGRSEPRNVVRGGAAFSRSRSGHQPTAQGSEDEAASYPHLTKKSKELGGLQVHAVGRTSGLQGGTILPAMSLVKMPGRLTDSLSWTVIGGFGLGGDSGAWVIDNATNHTCAHVLAWSERNGAAYVSPMDVLLHDISQTLHAPVSFPEPTATTAVTHGPIVPHRSDVPRAVATRAHGDSNDGDEYPLPAVPTRGHQTLPNALDRGDPSDRSTLAGLLSSSSAERPLPSAPPSNDFASPPSRALMC